jgi:hypothetical protein
MQNIFYAAMCCGLALGSVAHADDFEGAYVALGIGSGGITDSQTNYNTVDGGYPSGVPNGWTALLSDRGGIAAIAGGYTWQLAGFLVGVEGRLDRRRFDVTSFELYEGAPETLFTTRYVSEISRQVSVRFGKQIKPNYMAYFKVGRTWSEYTRTYQGALEDVTFGTDMGNVFGVGMEFAWTEDWNVNVDVSRMVYDRSVATLTNVYEEDAAHDLRENTFTLMVVKRF